MFPGPTVQLWPGVTAGSSSPTCAVCGAPLSMVLQVRALMHHHTDARLQLRLVVATSLAPSDAAFSVVAQAYAPLPQLPDRVLLVLGCTKAGCGKDAGCWQAFRCQLHPQQQQLQQQQSDSKAQAQQTLPSSQAAAAAPTGFDAAADWGFGAADGGSTAAWDAPQQQAPPGSSGRDALDFSDLTSVLTATVQQQQQHQQREAQKRKEQKKQPTAAEQDAASRPAEAAVGSSSKGAAGPHLPEFYLYAELEPGRWPNTECSKLAAAVDPTQSQARIFMAGSTTTGMAPYDAVCNSLKGISF